MFVCPECGASQGLAAACAADGTMMVAAGEDALLGQTVGVYRVARLLGIGGMGRVYKGVHPTIGSRVAIKVLSRECSDRRDLVERFFAEAKAVNLIRHESIVNVLDLATLPDGRPYIVMEYLDGSPLSSIIENAARAGVLLPLGGIARLVAEVLDALAAAHAKGIVHRDLKPDNIFVTPAGRAKVLDFGIAKLQPELGGSATHTGSLLGTPHYMSPEQASGRPVDARADIYAVGVILFECATLHKPFTADSLFELLRKHVEAPPPPVRTLRRDMPAPMEHVIMAALAKAPEHRFASAEAMSVALQQATSSLTPDAWAPIQPGRSGSGGWSPTPPASWARRDHLPTANATPTPSAPVSAPAKRSSTGLWLALVAIALVGAGATAAVVLSGGGEPATTTIAPGQARTASPPEPVARTTSPPEPVARTTSPPEPVARTTSPPEPTATTAPPPPAGSSTEPSPPPPARSSTEPSPTTSKIRAAAAKAPPLPAVASTPAPNPGGWFERHAIRPPGFDPKHANIETFIAFAYQEAHRYVPDAEAWWIDADGVFPDGHADLTLPSFASGTGSITVRFVSPSRAKPDPSVPRGVPRKTACAFYITIDPEGGEMYETSTSCKEKLVKRPRCTAAQVWTKALALHPDAKGAVAALVYRDWNGKGAWDFDIRDDEHPVSERLPDDC
jgi:serine/threonine-protein kinase